MLLISLAMGTGDFPLSNIMCLTSKGVVLKLSTASITLALLLFIRRPLDASTRDMRRERGTLLVLAPEEMAPTPPGVISIDLFKSWKASLSCLVSILFSISHKSRASSFSFIWRIEDIVLRWMARASGLPATIFPPPSISNLLLISTVLSRIVPRTISAAATFPSWLVVTGMEEERRKELKKEEPAATWLSPIDRRLASLLMREIVLMRLDFMSEE
ncbi:ORF933 [White spot syndrome virus]|uniref:Wsv376 n=3 Tax=White spot syndrome virus TaxID=342409 RepID=Q8VAM5_WSSVS|nr:wsv376 [Shrimp white spot syndrome virus]AFX59753.1 wsv376 [White spot syndrome virus]AAL33378.1 wsv376 [Shrimp white spot syndrome virus]AAL89303.1 WSSV435 [Shrimp white spot syndrome virus]ATU83461.1 ORF933 [White spot syndrome virus]AWQ60501.1 wsv376 [Shrimp white spot syndrome virus]